MEEKITQWTLKETRYQIIANCIFLWPPGPSDAKIDIILSLEEDQSCHAHVIHSTKTTRVEKLSGSGWTPCEAMHALLVQSSKNVSHFRKAYGAGSRRDFDSDDESDADEDEDLDVDDADVDLDDDVSVWNDGCLDPDESDDDEIMPTGMNKTLKPSVPAPSSASLGQGLVQRGAPAVSNDDRAAREGRTALNSAEDRPREPVAVTIPEHQGHPSASLVHKERSQGRRTVGEIGSQDAEIHQTQTANNTTITARAATPPQSPPSQAVVEDPGPSEAQTPPTLHALLGAAVGHVRTIRAPDVAGETPTLRGRVTRVEIGGSMWDLSSFCNDDMSVFFTPDFNGVTMPLFEIEVVDAKGLSA